MTEIPEHILRRAAAVKEICNCGWGGNHDPDNPVCRLNKVGDLSGLQQNIESVDDVDIATRIVRPDDDDVRMRRSSMHQAIDAIKAGYQTGDVVVLAGKINDYVVNGNVAERPPSTSPRTPPEYG